MWWRAGFLAVLLSFSTTWAATPPGSAIAPRITLEQVESLSATEAAQIFWNSDEQQSDEVLVRILKKFNSLESIYGEWPDFLAENVAKGRGIEFCKAVLAHWPQMLYASDDDGRGLYHAAAKKNRVDILEFLHAQASVDEIPNRRILLDLIENAQPEVATVKMILKYFPESTREYDRLGRNALALLLSKDVTRLPNLSALVESVYRADPESAQQNRYNKPDAMQSAIEAGNFKIFHHLAPTFLKNEKLLNYRPAYLEIAIASRHFATALEIIKIDPDSLKRRSDDKRSALSYLRLNKSSLSSDQKTQLLELLKNPVLELQLLESSYPWGIPLTSNLDVDDLLVEPTIAVAQREGYDIGKELSSYSLVRALIYPGQKAALRILETFPSIARIHGNDILALLSNYEADRYEPSIRWILENSELRFDPNDIKDFMTLIRLQPNFSAWALLQKNPNYLAHHLSRNFNLGLAAFPTPMREGGADKHYGLYLALKIFQDKLDDFNGHWTTSTQWTKFFEILAREGSRPEIVNDPRWNAGEILIVLENYLIALGTASQLELSEPPEVIAKHFSLFTQFMTELLAAQENRIQTAMNLDARSGSLWDVLQNQRRLSQGLKADQLAILTAALQNQGHFKGYPIEGAATHAQKSLRYLQEFQPLIRRELREKRARDESRAGEKR